MFRILATLSVFVVTAVPAVAQSDDDAEIGATLNRISTTLRLVHGESGKTGSELELVKEQKSQLALLREEYKTLVQAYYQLETVEKNDRGALVQLVAGLPGLEEKLNHEILLPHQAQILRSKVFNKFVDEQNGNMLKVMASYYPREFRLNEVQIKRLTEIEKRVANDVAELKKRFEKELLDLRNGARQEARKTLSQQQLEVLAKYQDNATGR